MTDDVIDEEGRGGKGKKREEEVKKKYVKKLILGEGLVILLLPRCMEKCAGETSPSFNFSALDKGKESAMSSLRSRRGLKGKRWAHCMIRFTNYRSGTFPANAP